MCTISKYPEKEYRIENFVVNFWHTSLWSRNTMYKERAAQTAKRFIGRLYYSIFINKNLSRVASVKIKRNILERRNSPVKTMKSLFSDEHLLALSWEYSRDIEWSPLEQRCHTNQSHEYPLLNTANRRLTIVLFTAFFKEMYLFKLPRYLLKNTS